MNFNQFRKKYVPQINNCLNNYFSVKSDDIFKIMKYALTSNGKRIRPLISLATYYSAGKNISNEIISIVSIVEFVHAYSLVHDDLPEMDNDSKRRNKDSVWKKYGVGNAVLGGDGLLTEAFKKITDAHIPEKIKLKLIHNLAKAAGPENMVRGQQFDLFGKTKIKSVENLKLVHLMKTGALISYSAVTGGILASLSFDALDELSKFGNNLGIAFQIKDDLNDIDQDKKEKRVSLPILIGVNDSKQKLGFYKERAKKIIRNIHDFQGELLINIVDKL